MDYADSESLKSSLLNHVTINNIQLAKLQNCKKKQFEIITESDVIIDNLSGFSNHSVVLRVGRFSTPKIIFCDLLFCIYV